MHSARHCPRLAVPAGTGGMAASSPEHRTPAIKGEAETSTHQPPSGAQRPPRRALRETGAGVRVGDYSVQTLRAKMRWVHDQEKAESSLKNKSCGGA